MSINPAGYQLVWVLVFFFAFGDRRMRQVHLFILDLRHFYFKVVFVTLQFNFKNKNLLKCRMPRAVFNYDITVTH